MIGYPTKALPQLQSEPNNAVKLTEYEGSGFAAILTLSGVIFSPLTAVFFETGAMLTPTKSQNGTNCGSGGLFQSYLTHS